MVGVERFELSPKNWEAIGAQFASYLGLAGGVAGDAQIEVGKLALDVLGRAEVRASIHVVEGRSGEGKAVEMARLRGEWPEAAAPVVEGGA